MNLLRAADRRNQPRRAAAMILGVGNIISGVAGLQSLGDHIAGYTYAARFMPLQIWWWSFIALGVVILLGPVSPRVALVTAVLAFGWWLMFSDFVWQAHVRLVDDAGQHLVSLRGVWQTAWMAVIHLLLTPYLRRKRHRGS